MRKREKKRKEGKKERKKERNKERKKKKKKLRRAALQPLPARSRGGYYIVVFTGIPDLFSHNPFIKNLSIASF